MEEKLAENYEKLEQDVEKIPEILAARSSKELTRHLVGLELSLIHILGHSERYGENLYKNVPDKMLQNLIFQGAVDYYK